MNLDIYTVGGQAIITEIFNAIAALTGTQHYVTILRLFVIFALTWLIIENIFHQKLILTIKWFIGVFLLYNVLLVPKATIMIHDTLTRQIQAVDHVPIGIAFPASMISTTGNALTQLVESTFTLPDDLRYQHSGMILGSQLIAAASHFQITDPDFARNIDQFIQQCVFYDLLLHKYALKELMNTHHIWQFLNEHAAQSRAFSYQHNLVTCKEGIHHLNEDWQQELERAELLYGVRFFKNNVMQDAKAQLMSYLPMSYHYLTGMSEQASNIMQQNMLINAIQQGLLNQSASVNATAAIENYTTQHAEALLRSSAQLRQHLSAYWLPILYNLFSMLFYGSFVLVFPLFLLPMGLSLFKNYLFSLFWLQCWGPLYAILNLIMTFYAAKLSSAQIFDPLKSGLSLATQGGLSQINQDIMNIAAYLTWSVPVIAYGIIRGGAASFSSLTNLDNLNLSSATREAVTGNYHLANTRFSTHASDNSLQHHHDHQASYLYDSFMTNHASGAKFSITSDHQFVVDTQNGMSHLPGNLRLSSSMANALSESAMENTKNIQKNSQAHVENISNTLQDTLALNHQSRIQNQFLEQYQIDEKAKIQEALQHTSSLAQQFGKKYGLEEKQSVELFAKASIGSKFGVGGSFESETTQKEAYEEAKKIVSSEQWKSDMSVLKQSYHRTRNEKLDRESDDFFNKLETHLNQSEESEKKLYESIEKTNIYQTASENIKKNELQWEMNLEQEFMNFLVNASDKNSHQPLGIDNAMHILTREPELLAMYQKQFMESQQESIIKNVSMGKFKEEIHHSEFKDMNDQIKEKFAQESQYIAQISKEERKKMPGIVHRDMQTESNALFFGVKKTMNNELHGSQQEKENLQKEVEESRDNHKMSLVERSMRGIDKVAGLEKKV